MISVRNIYKNFGNLSVLKAVSCEIEKGEKVVIIGPSGSGKSTLLRCMNLLEKPTFGEIWIDDKILTPIDPYLHKDVISKSKTFKKMFEEYKQQEDNKYNDEELANLVIKEIKEKDLLKEKHEGKEYKKLVKELYLNNYVDVDLARQKVGMCFQHFNLFNNLTIMDNLILAPTQLKLMTKEEAITKRLVC